MPPAGKGKAAAAGKHMTRTSSTVFALGPDGSVARNIFVWSDLAPACKTDPELVFAKCLCMPGTTEQEVKLKQVEPPGDETVFSCKYDHVWNVNDDTKEPLSMRDIGFLDHQNTAAVLDFLKARFMKNAIYTTADPLLVAVNPFRDVGVCTDDWIKKFREVGDITKLPPHSFGIARTALDNLHGINKSQTIIVTGESGAGKTEATKHCMRFFASAKSGIDLRIQNAVMAANPVLEAFGNAKTIRNNNSSRFGRFMQLSVGAQGGIMAGMVSGFLLEKVRVVSQEKDERSYHIFYQFTKGADANLKSRFKVRDPKFYRNLTERSGGCFTAPGIDDLEEWADVQKSFVAMGMNEIQKDAIHSIVSGVLLLGNVEFLGQTIDGQDNAAVFAPGSDAILAEACSLLYLDDVAKVSEGLQSTLKKMGTEEVMVRIQAHEARQLLASLGKAMYDNLFQWIIKKLNTRIEPEGGFQYFMGMLDIFGFEVFQSNSLEQLLINITNEFLQKNFVSIVFEKESKLYRDEGVSTAELVFTSNQEIIDCLIGKKASVFTCLEDACVAKGGTDEAFLSSMGRVLAQQPAFKMPPGGSAKELRFTIKHIIADIDYSAKDFVSKNMDILKPELAEACRDSSNEVVREMFEGVIIERGKLGKSQLIASQFVRQLDLMMGIIMQTEAHFIRCVKPNETKQPLDWSNKKVLNQLFSLSILEALQLKKLGFSFRRPFRDFVKQFRQLNLGISGDMEKVPAGDAREKVLAEEMLKSMGKQFPNAADAFRDKKEFQVGKTMIFLKPESVQTLLKMQREAMAQWAPIAVLLSAMAARHFRMVEVCVHLQGLIRTQARARTVLSRNLGIETQAPAGEYKAAPFFYSQVLHSKSPGFLELPGSKLDTISQASNDPLAKDRQETLMRMYTKEVEKQSLSRSPTTTLKNGRSIESRSQLTPGDAYASRPSLRKSGSSLSSRSRA